VGSVGADSAAVCRSPFIFEPSHWSQVAASFYFRAQPPVAVPFLFALRRSLLGRVKLEDAGFDWKLLAPDVHEVEYVSVAPARALSPPDRLFVCSSGPLPFLGDACHVVVVSASDAWEDVAVGGLSIIHENKRPLWACKAGCN
jgi:hypothetical protein